MGSDSFVRELAKLVLELKYVGDMLYAARNKDWLVPSHFDIARAVLEKADKVLDQLLKDGILSPDE
jgi:hypothetical protein